MRASVAIVLPCLFALAAAPPALAQDVPPEVTIPQENVRYDYAMVLDVTPVIQTLRTTKMERKCEDGEGRLARVVGAVKGALGGQKAEDGGDGCKLEPVTREYQRTIAYDVDFVYKGTRYRTRMDRDPGNRLRVRVSVTPQPMP